VSCLVINRLFFYYDKFVIYWFIVLNVYSLTIFKIINIALFTKSS